MTDARVTGLGGVFLKAQDAPALRQWYADHLGLATASDGAVVLGWRELDEPSAVGQTVWHVFPDDSDYFDPSESPAMVNYRVADLGALLVALEAAGVTLVGEPRSFEYGKFAWGLDPEGNKFELWEPPASAPFEVSVPPPRPGVDGARVLGARPTLEVRDVQSALRLYQDVLGFEVEVTVGEPPSFALLRRDGARLALARAKGEPAVAEVAAVYLDVSDVRAILERCEEAGVEVVVPLTEHPWGMTDFALSDVDGHKVAVGQRTG